MPRFNIFLILTAFSVVLLVTGTAASDSETSISISEQEQEIGITVPVAKLAIQLPKVGFKKVTPPIASGPTANPRYFLFDDQARGVRLSGWFESATRFTGVKDNPPGTLDGKPLVHRNVEFKKIGSWDTVKYEVTVGNITMAQLDAHLVQAGSWVELHLTAYPTKPASEQHELLAEVVRSIRIVEKK